VGRCTEGMTRGGAASCAALEGGEQLQVGLGVWKSGKSGGNGEVWGTLGSEQLHQEYDHKRVCLLRRARGR
jgi:hypothetical protein